CDFAVALPNDKMIGESKDDAASAFSKANLCVKACVEGVCNMLSKTGLINTDFAALKNLFKGAQNRSCAFSYASADGENSVDEAIKAFKNFPALGYALNASKADKLLVCARCGREVSMPELKSLLIEAAKKFCYHEYVLFGAIIEKSSARLAEVFAAGVEFLPEPFQSASEAPAPAQKFSLEHQKMPRAPFRPRARIPEPENSNQSEFGFVDDELKRGYFESTPQNFYYGEDLDIPSFVRKRVKI
ncbi:MAG: hypothetical protein J6P03_05335, partial [Opitutales bacterium]|nr:hypothetical protein [Opitutales bacterium]